MVEWIFIKFSGYFRQKNNLEHFDDVALNSLGSGLIYLFSGSVFAGNITEQEQSETA